MLTAREVYPIVSTFTGEPLAKVRNVGAALINAEVLPLSEKRGPAPEKLDASNVGDLVIAVGLDEPLRNVAKMTRI